MFYSRWAHRMSQWVQQSVNRYYLMYVYVIIIRLPEYCINPNNVIWKDMV